MRKPLRSYGPELLLVFRTTLDLSQCQLPGALRRAPAWKMYENRKSLMKHMHVAALGAVRPRRPAVRCVRFSTTMPDEPESADCLGFKTVIDCLLPERWSRGKFCFGLGLIDDDKPTVLKRVAWWEKVKQADQGCLFELWDLDPTAPIK